MFKLTKFAAASLGALLLSGCLETGSDAGETSNGTLPVGALPEGEPTVFVAFNPSEQIIPFPTNLLFEADTSAPLDGTINAPVDDPESSSAAVVMALNELDGFSTIAPWRMAFTGPVNPDTLVAGQTVRVFQMRTQGDGYPARVRAVGVERELQAEADFRVSYDADTHVLLIIPTRPLAFDTTYTAVITDGVRDASGGPVGSPLFWSIARGTSLLDRCDDPDRPDSALLQCTTNAAIEPLVEDNRYGLRRSDMLLAWGVTTQREDATFRAAADWVTKGGFVTEATNAAQEAGAKCTAPLCFIDLDQVKALGFIPVNPAPSTPKGKARILPGSIYLPSGLETASDWDVSGNPAVDGSPLSSQWACPSGNCNTDAARAGSEAPLITASGAIPVVLAVPDPNETGVPAVPEGGYPIVIFQHAIQQNRSNALAIADELALKGYATIAIDMPLHGLVLNQLEALPADHPSRAAIDLHAVRFNAQLEDSALAAVRGLLPLLKERTQYLDLLDAEGNDGSDGIIDPSGAHFLNPALPLTQRDILRQGGLDLVALAHYLRSGAFQQCGNLAVPFPGQTCGLSSLADRLNTTEIHFAGHSVGNIVAAPFLAYDKQIASVAMLTPTGGIMEALNHSATISPQLLDGLAASGVYPGTENFFRFFAVVQAAIDPVDPLNHARAISRIEDDAGEHRTRPVYLSQVVGNDGSTGEPASPPDLVLPATADVDAPLAGSTPLAQAMGLEFRPNAYDLAEGGEYLITPSMGSDGLTPDHLQIAVAFRYGGHATPLLPDTTQDEPRTPEEGDTVELPRAVEAHAEMQRQLADFLANPRELRLNAEMVGSN